MQQTVIKEQEDEQHYLVSQYADEAHARSEGSIPGKTVYTQIHFTVLNIEFRLQKRDFPFWQIFHKLLYCPRENAPGKYMTSETSVLACRESREDQHCRMSTNHNPRARKEASTTTNPYMRSLDREDTAMALSVTQILIALGVLQFMLLLDDQSVKVTEELLKQHEELQNQEMTWLKGMEKRIQEQTRLSEESLLLSACQRWWFWASVKILLVIFGFYWLPKQRSAGSDSGSQQGNSSSAQDQREEEDWEDESDPYNTQDKPLDKGSAPWWVCQ
ncbi:uncharacterized protein LOC113970254 [Neopelma chrysocephalum]|uniref:uncharacterized protein LOC113970254 n=1 Tax=Neopelma chrysocephalum TaxID=114329 RepID=UPI000FCD189C|nr:uncharacterized protein LOC113970254 [Neopelma chrysocephalum]